MNLALNNLQRLICHKTQPTNQLFHKSQSQLQILNLVPNQFGHTTHKKNKMLGPKVLHINMTSHYTCSCSQ